jgi:hypothetical protein
MCCGDQALGTALKEKGVFVKGAHPFLNGDKPTTLTYGPHDHWCQPVVTLHHMLPKEISSLWRFERQRELLLENPNVSPLTFGKRISLTLLQGNDILGSVLSFCRAPLEGITRQLE